MEFQHPEGSLRRKRKRSDSRASLRFGCLNSTSKLAATFFPFSPERIGLIVHRLWVSREKESFLARVSSKGDEVASTSSNLARFFLFSRQTPLFSRDYLFRPIRARNWRRWESAATRADYGQASDALNYSLCVWSYNITFYNLKILQNFHSNETRLPLGNLLT